MLCKRILLQICRLGTFPEVKFGRNLRRFSKPNYMMDYKPIQPVTLKIQSKELDSIYSPELNTLVEIFQKYGFDIRVAGGAVRDLLMGLTPHDLDFATTATPSQMKEMFEKENIRMINANGEKHGTITPRINDKENFEVTTLRIDVKTDGRHAEVHFTTDWQLDANRRDLTVNCLFMSLDGVVYDYFNGIEHIQKRSVVFVGDAATRIQEDYLRILRYFRFYGRISKKENGHDLGTLEAIRTNVSGLAMISGERIWSELKKILEGNYAGELMQTMVENGISEFIGLPTRPDIEKFLTIWQRLKGKNYNAITLLAGLINSEEEALNLHKRMKFSAYERDLLLFISAQGGHSSEPVEIKTYQDLIVMSRDKPKVTKEWTVQLLLHIGEPQMAVEIETWDIPRFPINGYLLKDTGVKGRQLGALERELKNLWVESNFEMDSEALMKCAPELAEKIKAEVPKKLKVNK